jgi:hypothetical protein
VAAELQARARDRDPAADEDAGAAPGAGPHLVKLAEGRRS